MKNIKTVLAGPGVVIGCLVLAATSTKLLYTTLALGVIIGSLLYLYERYIDD